MNKNQSSFFISVNPNISPYKDGKSDQNYIDLFEVVLEAFLENIDLFIDGKKSSKKWKYVIEDSIEEGGKFKRLGSHISIQIDHDSNISLNYNKIRDYFKKNLTNGKQINMRNETYDRNGPDGERILNYIRKTFGPDYKFNNKTYYEFYK
jgi:hypothetical protein